MNGESQEVEMPKRRTVTKRVRELERTIRSIRGVRDVMVAGSYRRKSVDVSDLDVIVLAHGRTKMKGVLKRIREVLDIEVSRGGDLMMSGTWGGLEIQFWGTTKKQEWGAMQLFATGSGQLNKILRSLAKRKGMKLNRYGLYDRDSGKRLAGSTEHEIFDALGLDYIEPHHRGEEPVIRNPDKYPVIVKLLAIARHYDKRGERFRAKAFYDAVHRIQPVLGEPEEWGKVLGPSTYKEATAILTTGKSQRLQQLESEAA